MLDIFSYMLGKEAAGGGGGGGSSSWELLATQEFEVSTESTSTFKVGEVSYPKDSVSDNDLMCAFAHDKAGRRSGYAYGTIIFAYYGAIDPTATANSAFARSGFHTTSQGVFKSIQGSVGVYPLAINRYDGKIVINAMYNSSYGTIDGTFKVDVYKLSPASGMSFN